MPYWDFRQNNTGGSFTLPAHTVVIEADDDEDANARAEAVGLYWNGCDDEIDCPCCGDRWYQARGAGTAEPTVYGQPVAKSAGGKWNSILVVHKDGREDRYGFETAEKLD